jgi:hypothetical protein
VIVRLKWGLCGERFRQEHRRGRRRSFCFTCEPVGFEEIDAGGLYAAITRFRHYVEHEFQPYESCAFGPDIEWGLELRRQGYRNYLDWTASVEHLRSDGASTHPRQTQPVRMTFTTQADSWRGQPS